MRVEGREGKLVDRAEVHREENLTGLHGRRDECDGFGGAAPGAHGDAVAGGEAEAGGVVGIDLGGEDGGGEFAEDGAFVGARTRVPLRGGAAARKQNERVVGVGRLRHRARGVEVEAGAGVRGEKLSVGEEAALLRRTWSVGSGELSVGRSRLVGARRNGGGRAGPLDAAGIRNVSVVADAGEVARLAGGKFFQNLEGGLGRRPRAEAIAAAPGFGDEFEDGEVAQGLAGGAGDFFGDGEAALAVDENAVLLAPAGGGEDEVGELGGLGRRIHVLHDEKLEFGEEVARGFG